MIFEPAANCQDKGLFRELVFTYVRIAESCAEIANIKIRRGVKCSPVIINEMINIGVVISSKDIPCLLDMLGTSLYDRFVSAIHFAVSNPTVVGKLLDKLNNKKRKALQRIEARSKKPTFVDFFAGAGGLSKGFTDAGFRVIFANDFQDVCVSTYKYNHPELSADNVSSQDVRQIVDNIGKHINNEVDVVIGGPPCQGFSSANKQPILDDPRNELYKYFLKAVAQLLPKFVVMENVKGMLTVANQVVEHFKAIKGCCNGCACTYDVSYRLLNSSNFGVAQNRERLIYIAVRSDIAKELHTTSESIFAEIVRKYSCSSSFLLRDALYAIRPLEAPRVKNQNDVDSEIWGRTIEPNRFVGNENAYLELINGGRKIPLTFNHRARYLSDLNYEIYRLLDQGDDATDMKIAAIMPYAHRNHCFKDKYFKLRADRPSRTITAHLKMDCHSHIHPFQIRAITPREAARCQSFPDDYLFLGAYLKTYMEIGNAVPVLMARGIASEILGWLQKIGG